MVHVVTAGSAIADGELRSKGPGDRLPMFFPWLGVVFWRLRKCGSTSVSLAMKQFQLGPLRRRKTRTSRKAYTHLQVEDLNAKIESDPSIAVIGLCRHPLSRLVAGFYSPAFHHHMDFPTFVRGVAALSDEEIDAHLRSQQWRLHERAEMLPLETAAASWARVQEVFASRAAVGDLEPAPPPLERLNKKTPRSWESHYDDELRAIAEARYAADFDRFGYERTT